jgi:8-amino-3,8-dideoxy-alpha-D-manno-octulosonate transaminase
MGELAGAVAGVQLSRLPHILERMRASKALILETIGDAPGLVRRRLVDPDGDGGSSITWFLRDADTAKRFAALLREEGVPAAQMYRGRPVYLTPAVMSRRTASGHYPTTREYGPGLCPQTEALVSRSVIVPVGVGYSAADCEHVGTAVRKLAEQHLS